MSPWLVPAEVLALRVVVEDALDRDVWGDRAQDALRKVRDVLACALVAEGVRCVLFTVETTDIDALDEEGVPYSVST